MISFEVHLDEFATAEEVKATRTIIKARGLHASVHSGYRKLAEPTAGDIGDEPEWIILIALAGYTFGSFFKGFVEEAGADAWRSLKDFVIELSESRRKPTGPEIPPSPPHVGAVHFRDEFGNEIREGVFPRQPSDEFWQAWREIDEPDWSQIDGWLVFWDSVRQTWAATARFPEAGHVRWDRVRRRWVNSTWVPAYDDTIRRRALGRWHRFRNMLALKRR